MQTWTCILLENPTQAKQIRAEKDTNQPQQKVTPPFKNIPSFLVAATILSYYSFNRQAQTLLYRLSKNGGLYYEKHQNILQAFFISWRPEIMGSVKFMDPNINNKKVFEFPTQDQLYEECKWDFK